MKTNTVSHESAIWLRLEAAAALVAFLGAYAWCGGDWWYFAGLFLLPDLFMLGYLRNARTGAWLYNLGHTYSVPLALLAVLWASGAAISPLWLVWLAHIAFDRMMGYGLKQAAGFGYTHLGVLGLKQPDGAH